MESLKKYLVVCDMDNTLLTAREGILACNLAAIRLFMAMGGRFTVATGRRNRSVQRFRGWNFPARLLHAAVLCCMIFTRTKRWICIS